MNEKVFHFEKSIFIPEELTNAFNDFFESQRAFLGNKSIKERQEELGEFFDDCIFQQKFIEGNRIPNNLNIYEPRNMLTVEG